MVLTVYSKNYDMYSYTVNNGLSSKVFLENGKSGKEFKNVEDAIDFVTKASIMLDEIVYCFQTNGKQYFRKFKIDNSADPGKLNTNT